MAAEVSFETAHGILQGLYVKLGKYEASLQSVQGVTKLLEERLKHDQSTQLEMVAKSKANELQRMLHDISELKKQIECMNLLIEKVFPKE